MQVIVTMDELWGLAAQCFAQDTDITDQQRQVVDVMMRFKYLAKPADTAPWAGGVEQGRGGVLAVLDGGYASDDLGMVLQVMALTKVEIEAYGVSG